MNQSTDSFGFVFVVVVVFVFLKKILNLPIELLENAEWMAVNYCPSC